MKKVILVCLFIGFVSLIFAQEKMQSRNRYALVIGNQAYADYPLSTNVADAKMIASSLISKEFDVTLKTDIFYEDFYSEVNAFINKVNQDPQSVVLFYFTGHGFTYKNENYLLSIDNDLYHTEEDAIEYAINVQKEIADKIYTNAQIYILDGAYENPFRKEGVRALGIKGGLSAAKSSRESTVGFLFSAAPEALVLEQTGKNSLFATKLNNQILNSKANISDIFNKVKVDVSVETEYQQVPYSSTTTMNFAFNGNELIALQKKAALKTSDDLTIESYEIKRSYEADQVELMLQKSNAARNADEKTQRLIEESNQRKRIQEEEDRRRAQEEALRAKERSFYEQKEIEDKRREFIEAEQELRSSLQKDSTVEERIEYIESLKAQLNQLRFVSLNQIEGFEREKQLELDEKTDSIMNGPLSIVEKDANGNITADAKKRRQQKVDNIVLSNQKEVEDYKKEKLNQLKEDNAKVLPILANAYTKLEKSTYVATNINDSLLVRVGNYDGQTATWKLHISSSFFDYENLFDEYMDLSYSDVTGSKKTDILKMTDEQMAEYNANIEIYNSLFNSSTPVFYVKLTYEMLRWKDASEYHFVPVKCEIIRLGKKSKVIKTLKKQDLKSDNFILYPQEEVRTKAEIKKDIERAEKILETENKGSSKTVDEILTAPVVSKPHKKETITKNDFDRFFEDDTPTPVEKGKKEKVKVTKIKNETELRGRSTVEINASVCSTNVLTPQETDYMYDFTNGSPFFYAAGFKLTTAWTQYMYGGFSFDYCSYYDYENYKESDLPEYVLSAGLLSGINFNIGKRLRFYAEDNITFSIDVLNVMEPTPLYGTIENTIGLGLGCGFDFIPASGEGIYFTVGYRYNWQRYTSKFDITVPDYCQSQVYLGIGYTW